MFTRVKNHLEYLRQQPEHVRLRVAIRYTLIIGAIIAALWLIIFLPLQIRSLFS